MSYIEHLESLKSLECSPAIGVESIDDLPPNLVGLHLRRVSGIRDCGRVEGLKRLEMLSIEGADELDDFDVVLSRDSLRSLNLSRNENLRCLDALPTESRIRELLIAGTSISDLSPLTRLKWLRRLDISGCRLTDYDLLNDLPSGMTLIVDQEIAASLPGSVRKKMRLFVRAHVR